MSYSDKEILQHLNEDIDELKSRLSFTVDLNQRKKIEREIKIKQGFWNCLTGYEEGQQSNWIVTEGGRLTVVYERDHGRFYDVCGIIELNGRNEFHMIEFR